MCPDRATSTLSLAHGSVIRDGGSGEHGRPGCDAISGRGPRHAVRTRRPPHRAATTSGAPRGGHATREEERTHEQPGFWQPRPVRRHSGCPTTRRRPKHRGAGRTRRRLANAHSGQLQLDAALIRFPAGGAGRGAGALCLPALRRRGPDDAHIHTAGPDHVGRTSQPFMTALIALEGSFVAAYTAPPRSLPSSAAPTWRRSGCR